ncbi:Arginine biosynthesis bifunctional protein ArgJ [Planctomycetes bacterium Pan216]|uniref:Arginine biosynthesis bifunctional protein ArgJ n=1 Tax=Kolteria novifilia TaxID=2527975 RepID=A0A518B9C5_9BACT|nr:Arginine biosynthesis bifunctional protein ArgJ [Planctomycetes bacterium Pan216]
MTEESLPLGYQFAGVACGIKDDPTTKDLALIVSDRDSAAVGVFTTNRVKAAPVLWCQDRLPATDVRGIVVNSGNANACTGERGRRDAQRMAQRLATALGANDSQVLVGSTGVIGHPLPIEIIESGIDSAAKRLERSSASLELAARAIMTTDTRPKLSRRTLTLAGGAVTVLGIAKGAAMIGPNMATMLSYIMTDAVAGPDLLEPVLRQAVDRSFHCISVEGHTSTNDTVLLLANGATGVAVDNEEQGLFEAAVTEVACELSRAIIDDAEGASHVITLDVRGCRTEAEARTIAKEIADSALVKTAVFGNDPNWGRIVSAAGYAGVAFEETEVSLRVNGTLLYDHGVPTPFDADAESKRMKDSRETHLELDLESGDARCRFWTSDLTHDYVHLNADYTT